ncbi:MAG: hypothetical protein JWR61_5536 [Ferruginibacter sp.]|nr:hypothetical protein [Ferruginibacter sp.]
MPADCKAIVFEKKAFRLNCGKYQPQKIIHYPIINYPLK